MELSHALEELRELQEKLYAYAYAMRVMEYDSETAAPQNSAAGRGEALALLSGVEYELAAGEETGRLLKCLEDRATELTVQQAAEVRELRRRYDQTARVPAREYIDYARLVNAAGSAWRSAKQQNDFASFAPYIERLVDTLRRFAGYYAPEKNAYDVWLDQYEPGLDTVQLDSFFAMLRGRIVPLLRRVQQEGKPVDDAFLRQNWPLEGQKKLSALLMEKMGLDPNRCALGETEHPFTTNFSRDDVRITTHYYPENFTFSMFSVIHEGGHALYELNTAPRLARTCLAEGASMGIHESQSRLYENLIGRSRPFAHVVWPLVCQCFPHQTEGITEEQFWRAVNKVEPSLIRTEADELTYCLHIMVRYELEKELFSGNLAVADLPDAWNARMREYLGVQVPDDTHGVLQDTHWGGGSFGYFPSYALGSAYGAQIMAAMRRDLAVDALVEEGNLGPITAWLTEKIYQYGKEKQPAELLENACGASFDPNYYVEYLENKYKELYRLR